MGSLRAGMNFESLNHINMILSQWWFIEHLHAVWISMILVMMCQGEIFTRWHNFWCLWNTLLLLFFSDHFEFSDDRYGITFFGKIQSVRRTSVRNYEHRIIKWLVIIKQMGILFKVCDSIYIYIYISVSALFLRLFNFGQIHTIPIMKLLVFFLRDTPHFIEHVHALGLNMILAIIEIRGGMYPDEIFARQQEFWSLRITSIRFFLSDDSLNIYIQ